MPASAVSGGGGEKRQAIQKNLMGLSEGDVEDDFDEIDKADLDEFVMN